MIQFIPPGVGTERIKYSKTRMQNTKQMSCLSISVIKQCPRKLCREGGGGKMHVDWMNNGNQTYLQHTLECSSVVNSGFCYHQSRFAHDLLLGKAISGDRGCRLLHSY